MRNDLGHDSFLETEFFEIYEFKQSHWSAELRYHKQAQEWNGPEYWHGLVKLERGKGVKPPKELIERAVAALYITRGVIKHADPKN